MVRCVLLAGYSETDPKLFELEEGDISNKALLPIDGQPMIQYIVSALDESESVSDIVIVGPETHLLEKLEINRKKCQIVNSNLTGTGKVLDNLLVGIDYLKPQNNILVVTSDIPLITPEAIDDFISQCDNQLDLFYPVIPKEVNEQKFPGAERTYVNLIDGSFTGGNVFYLNPNKVRPCYDRVDRVIRNRKNPLLMAMNFGVCFLGQFMLGKLSLQQAEQKISQILNIDAKVVISKYPELGIDIDKASDMELAQQIIADDKLFI